MKRPLLGANFDRGPSLGGAKQFSVSVRTTITIFQPAIFLLWNYSLAIEAPKDDYLILQFNALVVNVFSI